MFVVSSGSAVRLALALGGVRDVQGGVGLATPTSSTNAAGGIGTSASNTTFRHLYVEYGR